MNVNRDKAEKALNNLFEKIGDLMIDYFETVDWFAYCNQGKFDKEEEFKKVMGRILFVLTEEMINEEKNLEFNKSVLISDTSNEAEEAFKEIRKNQANKLNDLIE